MGKVGKRPNSGDGIVKKKQRFLSALRESGNVVRAAREAGIGVSTAYQLSKHPDYTEIFEAAKAEGEQALAYRLLEEARRRAEEGVLEPVFYQGQEVGMVRKYSDNLLMFKIKGLMPHFRDNFPAIDIHSTGPTSVRIELEDTARAADGSPHPEPIDIFPQPPEEDGGLPDLSAEE